MTAMVATAEAKARLSELVNRVIYGEERVLIMRRGKPVAALISMEELNRLETAADAGISGDTAASSHPIMRAFGGWAGRTDLDALVTEIYADRQATPGREVAL